MYNKKVQLFRKFLKILESLEKEGRKSVIEYVLRRFGISVSSKNSGSNNSSVENNILSDSITVQKNGSTVQQDKPLFIKDIRAFAEVKKPKSVIEQIIVVAFYLSQHANEDEKTEVFKSEHIKKYFKQAKFSSSSSNSISANLIHTEKAGYIEKTAWGKYKLTTVGFNLVNDDLPRKDLITNPKQLKSTKRKKLRNK